MTTSGHKDVFIQFFSTQLRQIFSPSQLLFFILLAFCLFIRCVTSVCLFRLSLRDLWILLTPECFFVGGCFCDICERCRVVCFMHFLPLCLPSPVPRQWVVMFLNFFIRALKLPASLFQSREKFIFLLLVFFFAWCVLFLLLCGTVALVTLRLCHVVFLFMSFMTTDSLCVELQDFVSCPVLKQQQQNRTYIFRDIAQECWWSCTCLRQMLVASSNLEDVWFKESYPPHQKKGGKKRRKKEEVWKA